MAQHTQEWNPQLYDQKHSFVFEYGQELLGWLDPQPGERILDLGCGTGHLTHTIAEAGAQVVGLDNSPSMIDAARQAYPELEFVCADASDIAFPEPFDAVFSNAALHWMTRPEAVVTHIANALRPGGRFVAELGGKGNIVRIMAGVEAACQELGQPVQQPWYFPSIGEYASLLEKHGLAVTRALLLYRPTKLEGPEGMQNWFKMFGDALLHEVPEAARAHILERIEEKLRASLYRGGTWYADYRRLRIMALKE